MKAIIKYRLHPGIIAIKEKCVSSFSFSFSQVERNEIIKEINKLKANKAIHSTDIPTKLVKENSIFYSIFSSAMKNSIITPAYKKETKTSKDNYRPLSILSNISKI